MTTVFWLTCIFHCVGFSTSNVSDYEHEARIAAQANKYKDAALLYERCVFLSTETEKQAEFLIEKAKCYWAINDFERSLSALKRITTYNLSDSTRFETEYCLASNHYMQGNYQNALAELQQIQAFTSDINLVEKTHFLAGLTFIQLKEWQKAKLQFVSWANTLDETDSIKSVITTEITSLLMEENLPKYKNPETAKILSMYLPGAGQLYSGFFWEGAASLTFQLAGLAILGYGIYSQYYVTGGVVGFGIFQRFYSGGVKRAQFLAEKRNFRNIKTLIEKAEEVKRKH